MELKKRLQALYQLQLLDSALAALQRQYGLLDKGQAEQAAYDTAEATHTEADTALHTTTASLRDAELEQKTIEQKRAEYETKLYSGKVTAAKELQAMQDEIEMLGRQRGKLDEKILTLMDELEMRRKMEAATKQTLTAAAADLKAKRAAYKTQAETMVAQARELSTQRQSAAKQIAPDLLKRYETMRAAKSGIAIAALEDGNACGGCKMGLPSSIVLEVHEGNTIQTCQNCGRMLCEKP